MQALILAAGYGKRLGELTKYTNKCLVRIGKKPAISYIIEKFPREYDFIIALGYKGDSLKEYCIITYPDHKFTFVDIDNIDGVNSGPGYSALKCKSYLQRPFYFIVADCIIDSKIPHLDGNWLGVYPTSYPEKYSTVEIDNNNNILNFTNKNPNGYDNAFIGLASITDFNTFWNELETNISNGEIVSAFKNSSKYINFKIKHLKWLDTGNLDDLNRTKEHFDDEPLSLSKTTGEIAYKTDKFVKFHPDKNIIKNKSERAKALNQLLPSNFKNTNNFISYDWEPGNTLYQYDSSFMYSSFLDKLKLNIEESEKYEGDKELFDNFYKVKTDKRVEEFINRFGLKYITQNYNINNKSYNNLQSIINKIDVNQFYNNLLYTSFHGDLQFDNIIYHPSYKKFTYIDWRESFGGSTKGGDIYYDLAKLYGGSIIPYNIMKDEDSISLVEGSTVISYSYPISDNLNEFRKYYEKWIVANGFDLNKVKLITGIIFLNMSPLHDEKFAKMLWFKSIEILSEYYK